MLLNFLHKNCTRNISSEDSIGCSHLKTFLSFVIEDFSSLQSGMTSCGGCVTLQSALRFSLQNCLKCSNYIVLINQDLGASVLLSDHK